MQQLKVAALIIGQPGAQELWTLRNMASVPCALYVIQASQASLIPRSKRLKRLIREHGLFGTGARFLGGIIGSRIAEKDRATLNELFDFADLHDWWNRSGIVPVKVRALNHEECQSALARIGPDVIVRVSGGILKPRIFSLSRIVTLNVHHGLAPMIRGMWSIPWGIVEGRRDWIGATVHVIDAGIDTGRILWRGGPQIAPGDTDVDLLFRTYIEAVDALVRILNTYARRETPTPWVPAEPETSVYRSAPGILEWTRLLWLGRGRRARAVLETGTGC